jgi:hypothetical protein
MAREDYTETAAAPLGQQQSAISFQLVADRYSLNADG